MGIVDVVFEDEGGGGGDRVRTRSDRATENRCSNIYREQAAVLGTSKPRPMCCAISPMLTATSANEPAKEPPLSNASRTQTSAQLNSPIGQFNYPDTEAGGPGTYPLNVAQRQSIHPMTRHSGELKNFL